MLRLHGVRLARGGRTILDGVSFEASRGEVVALMGASGAGKTTVLRAIAALEPIDGGSIAVDDVAITNGACPGSVVRRLRHKVGMVFQFHCLFEHLPVLANVCLAPVHVQRRPPAEVRRQALELLGMLGVEHRAAALPRELSGGEAQRVAIARALAVDPPVLLLDEPSASLDAARRAELATVLRQLAGRGRTLVVATHDEEFARAVAGRFLRVGDRIVREARGELAALKQERPALPVSRPPTGAAF
jgi:ABC-type polar amino acid transport system ATPase subunit